MVLQLSQENIWFDQEGFERKYIYRRGLEGLVVARIIAVTWYLRFKQKYVFVGVLLPLIGFWGVVSEVFLGISLL